MLTSPHVVLKLTLLGVAAAAPSEAASAVVVAAATRVGEAVSLAFVSNMVDGLGEFV